MTTLKGSTPNTTTDSGGSIVTCNFCGGRGLDPFGVLSVLSKCAVCKGTGVITVPEPQVKCVFCHGSGVHPDTRMTCLGCAGHGLHTVPKPHETCPHCDGQGHELDQTDFACTVCHGAGTITNSTQAGSAHDGRNA